MSTSRLFCTVLLLAACTDSAPDVTGIPDIAWRPTSAASAKSGGGPTVYAYTLSGASKIATLFTNPTTATPNPAVTLRAVGTSGGHAAAFSYDLATSIVYTRQGNPAWAAQERDGVTPIRSDDKFYGAATGDP